MILKYLYSVFLVLFFSFSTFAIKGRILAIGGGSEQTNGWSKPAYQWAVDKSANKRVAIIGYSTPTNFLRDYFTINLGARFAKDFTITSKAMANTQEIYDSIVTYDVIFFRGGDQSLYYSYFKGTQFFDAVTSVFNRGGVIAGTSAGLHILSGIVYTAETPTSVTPEDALMDINSSDFTLKNDFFQFFPGYIFDSHVAERGRLPRTISFLARWKFGNNQNIKALAVDDLTAIAIDTNEIGTVFGTGAAGIYENVAKNISYQKDINGLLYADSIIVKQLTNGWQYDFINNIIIKPTASGLNNTLVKSNLTKQNNIYLTSSENRTLNKDFVTDFSNVGTKNDRVLIISDALSSIALGIRDELTVNGVNKINIISNSVTDTSNIKFIKNSYKFIFVGNTFTKLKTFLEEEIVGEELNKQIQKNGSSLAFLGDNARFAGGRVLSENYKGRYTAYDNLITTTKGLSFLSSFIIFPNALGTSDNKENSVCAIPYFMMKDSLQYGVLLNGDNYIKYSVSENGKAQLSGGGRSSVVLFRNVASQFSPSTITSRNNGTQLPRQVMGFDSMYVSLISKYNKKEISENINYSAPDTIALPATVTSSQSFFENIDIELYPNPSYGKVILKSQTVAHFVVSNLLGVEILKGQIEKYNTELDLSHYKGQILIIDIKSSQGMVKKKLIIN